MTPATMHRIHFPLVGEGVVHEPGGTPYETDDVLQYPLGSYLRLGNKGFVYALSAGITNTSFGVKNSVHQINGWASIAADAAVGATSITFDMASDQGTDGSGNIAEDYLVGGEIMLGPLGGRLTVMSRTIVSNTELIGGGGGECTVVIDTPIHTALVADTSVCEVIASLYKGVATDIDAYHAVVGIATCLAASGKYLWLQVEGPCGGLISQLDVGEAGSRFQCVFRHDGSIGPHDDADAYEEFAQHAGYIMVLAKANTQGLPFIMLQIAH